MRTLRGKYRNRNLTGGTGPIILKKILSKEHRGAVLGFVRAPVLFTSKNVKDKPVNKYTKCADYR